jgi:hypothetical protein
MLNIEYNFEHIDLIVVNKDHIVKYHINKD